MIRSVPLAFVLSLLTFSLAAADAQSRDPAKVPAGSYELDKRHASLVVKVVHMGFSHYTMRFTGLSGSFTYDPTAYQDTKVSITVDPKSIEGSSEHSFDKTIAGYFEPDKYPVIQFTSTGLTTQPDGTGKLTGDLNFHGVTKPVTLDVTFNGVGPGILGAGTRLGFTGSGRINRKDFGVTGGKPFAGDAVDLLFEVEFVKK